MDPSLNLPREALHRVPPPPSSPDDGQGGRGGVPGDQQGVGPQQAFDVLTGFPRPQEEEGLLPPLREAPATLRCPQRNRLDREVRERGKTPQELRFPPFREGDNPGDPPEHPREKAFEVEPLERGVVLRAEVEGHVRDRDDPRRGGEEGGCVVKGVEEVHSETAADPGEEHLFPK